MICANEIDKRAQRKMWKSRECKGPSKTWDICAQITILNKKLEENFEVRRKI